MKGQKPQGIAYLIGRADHMLSRILRNRLKSKRLTTSQYTMLSILNTHGQTSNAKLAERSLMTPQSANEQVKNMEAEGWIQRAPDQSHGRIINLALTETGTGLLEDCDELVSELEAKMLSHFEPQDKEQMQRLLRLLIKGLHDLDTQ
ncbi:MarR family winged helix-turn-helix transcriptional regulator [Leeia oryzae]|uniref:MarR family winged helix-turn-helix transcriptional regulator n=1 Tax=Leeia oryzae TaxID=356662 RepID=UPI00035C40FF|nr:MarR family winged helix-turn-helix transcriptional regulator [Leeia oryzae]